MRQAAVRMARATLRSGSSVSAAATATISVPPKANTTTSSAAPTPAKAVRGEAAMRGEVGQPRRSHPGQPAQQQRRADQDEGTDRGDLEDREPELELAEVAHAHQVDHGEADHEQQGGRHRQPGPQHCQQPGRTHGLGRDHDHHLHPPQPADRGPGGRTGRRPRRPRTRRGTARGGHLAQRVHHDDHQRPGHQVGQQHGRAGQLHAHAGAEKQAGADRAARAHHDQLARLEGVCRARSRSGSGRQVDGHRAVPDNEGHHDTGRAARAAVPHQPSPSGPDSKRGEEVYGACPFAGRACCATSRPTRPRKGPVE